MTDETKHKISKAVFLAITAKDDWRHDGPDNSLSLLVQAREKLDEAIKDVISEMDKCETKGAVFTK